MAPYGAWPFDHVILLVALLGPAARLTTAGRQAQLLAGTLFIAVNGLALLQLLAGSGLFLVLLADADAARSRASPTERCREGPCRRCPRQLPWRSDTVREPLSRVSALG